MYDPSILDAETGQIQLNFDGKTLTAEHIVAGYLNMLYRASIKSLLGPGELVLVTHPVGAPESMKLALQKACAIAQIDAQLVCEGVATVNGYLYNKKQEILNIRGSRTVAFIDIGHSTTSVTVATFRG